MAYIKFIAIHHYDVSVGVVDTEISNSTYLSEFDIDSYEELICALKEVINNENEGMLWGQDKIMIDSRPEISYCFNEIEQEKLPDVFTQDLLNLILQIRGFKELYSNPENLKKIVGQAFTMIKSNTAAYKLFTNSTAHFRITIDGVQITLTLLPEAFDLTESEYTEKIKSAI